MNPWAARRKGVIFLIVLIALLIIVGIPSYFALQNKPNCMNAKKDGDETGVDCGGSCQLLCVPETLPLISRGDPRLLKIASSTYVIALPVENPNINGTVVRAPYVFIIYPAGSKTPIKSFERETYIGRSSSFALFEGPFTLDVSGPFRTVFEWGPNLKWEKSEAPTPLLVVEDRNLIIGGNNPPKLEANITNKSQVDETNIEAVALLSDSDGNIVATGKTFVDTIHAGESVPISFSWPNAFSVTPVSITILPHVLPDKSYIR